VIDMDRRNAFKEFVRKNDYVYQLVKDKKYTWQELYEFFDIYGEDADVFKMKEEVKSEVVQTGVLATLVNAAKNIDVDKMNESIESIKKFASMFNSLSSKDETNNVKDEIRKRRYKRFDE
jgi:hypothetical protein